MMALLWVPLFLKRNSLCAKGLIQLIQDADNASYNIDQGPCNNHQGLDSHYSHWSTFEHVKSDHL